MKMPLKLSALWKSEYLGSDQESDPEFFASQVGSTTLEVIKEVPVPDKNIVNYRYRYKNISGQRCFKKLKEGIKNFYYKLYIYYQ
jgi:hypothetical protein